MSADFEDDGLTDPFRTLDPEQRLALHGELTGDDLVAAVLADPDSDEPRLVYGDYLLTVLERDARGDVQPILEVGFRPPTEATIRAFLGLPRSYRATVRSVFGGAAPPELVETLKQRLAPHFEDVIVD